MPQHDQANIPLEGLLAELRGTCADLENMLAKERKRILHGIRGTALSIASIIVGLLEVSGVASKLPMIPAVIGIIFLVAIAIGVSEFLAGKKFASQYKEPISVLQQAKARH